MPDIKGVSRLSHRGVRALNEDAVLVDESRGLFGIFDGASSLTPTSGADGKTGAYLAANLVRDIFAGSRGSLKEMALEANAAIEQLHYQLGIDVDHMVERFGTTAAVVKLKAVKLNFCKSATALPWSFIVTVMLKCHLAITTRIWRS